MKVEVTQEDIDRGEPHNPSYCAIAIAVKRQYPELCSLDVSVWAREIELENATYIRYYLAPLKVSEFIEKFDRGEQVEPFTFTMRLSSKERVY